MKNVFTAALAAMLAATLAPVASADVSVEVAEDLKEALGCHYTGSQGTITTVPYYASVDGTYWQGSYYYVEGSYSYQDVNRYNYCVAGFQVGAVQVTYSHSSSWRSCVNCVAIGTLLA